MKVKIVALLPPLLIAFGVVLSASDVPQKETESTVPELMDFHEIIYPIWHSAYPAKDYAELRSYVKDVDAGAKKMFDAKLPGILRDKEADWKKGIETLKQAVIAYDQAVAGKDDQALLNAAENLHSTFEMLVRIIRPVLEEVDAFHRVLYVVYHKYLPEKHYDQIRTASQELVLKAGVITKATLPEWLKDKAEPFKAAAERLQAESKKLADICTTGKSGDIDQAVEELHSQYQALEKIFD